MTSLTLRRMHVLPVLFLVLVVIGLVQVGAASAEPAVGISKSVDGNYYLDTFDTSGGSISSQRRITGVLEADVVGISVRPSTGALVITGSSNPGGPNNTTGRAYTLDYATAVATPIAAPFSSTLTDLAFFATAFDPTTDQLRVVNTSGANFRVDPVSGAIAGTDSSLGAAIIPTIAYDRNVAGTAASTLYGIDTNMGKLVRIGGIDGVPSANGGVVTQIGTVGVGLSVSVSLAISPATGVAYATSPPATNGTSNIFTANLTTGLLTQTGTVDAVLLDMALLPPSTVQVGAAAISTIESSGVANVTVTRTGDMRVASTVQYTTVDGSAKAGSDYVAGAGTVDFPAGVASRTIQVPVIADGVFEPSETFTVTLSSAAGGSMLGAPATTTVTITSPADTAAPKVLALPLPTRTVRTIARSGVVTSFSCSEACTAQTKLFAGRKQIGASKTLTLTTANTGVLRLRTTKLGQAQLVALAKRARTQRVRLLVVLTVRDPSGNTRVVRLPVVAVR